MREVLGKKLSKGTKKDLDDISTKTGITLKSCRRQVGTAARPFGSCLASSPLQHLCGSAFVSTLLLLPLPSRPLLLSQSDFSDLSFLLLTNFEWLPFFPIAATFLGLDLQTLLSSCPWPLSRLPSPWLPFAHLPLPVLFLQGIILGHIYPLKSKAGSGVEVGGHIPPSPKALPVVPGRSNPSNWAFSIFLCDSCELPKMA